MAHSAMRAGSTAPGFSADSGPEEATRRVMSKMGATSAQAKAEPPKKKLDYRPLAGAPDEMLGPDGEVRPVWRHFLDDL